MLNSLKYREHVSIKTPLKKKKTKIFEFVGNPFWIVRKNLERLEILPSRQPKKFPKMLRTFLKHQEKYVKHPEKFSVWLREIFLGGHSQCFRNYIKIILTFRKLSVFQRNISRRKIFLHSYAMATVKKNSE